METKNNFTNNNSFDYTEESMIQLQAELTAKSKEIILSIYTIEELRGVKTHLEAQLRATKINKLRLIGKTPILRDLNTVVLEDTFKTSISSFNEEEKRNAWLLRNLEQRDISLTALLNTRQQLSGQIVRSLTNIFKRALHKQRNKLDMGEVLAAIKLKLNNYKTKDGEEHPLSEFGLETIKLQLVHELVVLGILEVTTHRSANKGTVYDVSIPKARVDKISLEEIDYLINLSHIIKYNTILVKPARINKKMMSHSSWYYETLDFSEQQIQFVNTMHSIKWKFVPNAEELIEEAYRLHLAPKGEENTFVLPKWSSKRIEEFKRQIRVSNANGGHYIRGIFDGSLRWVLASRNRT